MVNRVVNKPINRYRFSGLSVLSFQYLLFIFVLFCGIGFVIIRLPANKYIYLVCVALVIVFIWSLWSWKSVTRNLFDPYILFFVAAAIFNSGQAFLEVFGLNRNGILNGDFSSDTILKALYLVLLGLTSFHLGSLTAAVTKVPKYSRKQLSQRKRYSLYVRIVGWFLILISMIPAIYVLRSAINVAMVQGYSGLFRQQVATGAGASFRVLATFLVPGALFLLAGSRGRIINLVVATIVILSYATIMFLLGSRSQAAMPLIAFAWTWHKCIKNIPTVFLISSGASLLFVVFPFIRATRNIAGEGWLNPKVLLDAFRVIDNPAIEIISEMGGSVITVMHTLELVPLTRGFDLGSSYFYAILTIVPNLFWELHPTIAHGLLADWLAKTVVPSFAALGGGLGFSFIAEAYMNFGWVGSPVILVLIGFLYARLVLWAQFAKEPAKVAMVASFITFFLVFSRGESGSIIRPLFWYALIPYSAVILLSYLDFSFKRKSYSRID